MKVKLTVWSIGDHLTPGGCGTFPPLSVDDLQKEKIKYQGVQVNTAMTQSLII